MSAIENVKSALDALEAAADLNCVTHLLTEKALGDAEALDALSEDARGPLHGLPFVVKANVAAEGAIHDGASPALKGHRASSDAGIVKSLREAGAVPVALTNMHELAFGITSHNAAYGTVRNPINPAHMTGGSSGGTAAAIGAQAVAAGIASDTGGSGRLPAAFCGCVGLRPSQDRYPKDGILTLSHTLDTATVMGRDVAMVAALDAAVTGEATLPEARTPRLGVLRNPFWTGLSRDMADLGQGVLAKWAAAGATLVEKDVPEIEALTEASGFPIALTETRENWERFAKTLRGQSLAEFAEKIASADVRELYRAMARGDIPPREAYDAAMNNKRPALQACFPETFAEMQVDALIFPTLARTAPLIGETEEVVIDGQSLPFFPTFTRRELAASVAGLPAISVPCGVDAAGLPFGMELVGTAGSDRALLGLAQHLEKMVSA